MMATTTPASRLCDAIAEAWRPRERLSTPEWCSRYVRLPPEFGRPGRYDLDEYPYWRGPLEAKDDPEIEEIVLQAATQVGKTEALKGMLASESDLDPCPMMLVGPDKDYIAEMRDKIYSSAEINAVLRDRIPPKAGRNMRWVDFGTCYCYLAWVGNTQRVSGKAAKIVLCSEVSRYKQPAHEGAIQKLVAERVKSFTRFKIIWESTPQDETCAISALYEKSDRRKYHVPCPHCGHFQELRFFPHKEGKFKGFGGVAGLTNSKGDWLNADQVRESAYYLCEKGCHIDSEDKPEMVRRGVWVPGGQHVTPKGKLAGVPWRSSRIAGFQLGSILANVISFGRIAAEYIASREAESELRNFFNNWLGLKYTIRTKVPAWRTLGLRQQGAYDRGKIPAAALFCTAGIDVQDDRVYWIVRAWGEGATSWLVDWGMCSQTIGTDGSPLFNSDLEQLEPLIIARNFALQGANPLGAVTLPVRLACADCNYQPARVWEWVRKHPGDQVRAVAGDHQMLAQFFQVTVVEKSARDGKPYPGGLQRWGISRQTYNQDIQQRWSIPLDKAGAWWLPAKILDEGETYLRQLVNETETTERNKAGRQVSVWKVIDQRVGNHFWDCEAYARAAADMITGRDWQDLVAKCRTSQRKAAKGEHKDVAARDFNDDFSSR